MNEEIVPTSADLSSQGPTTLEATSETATQEKLETYLAKDEYDYQLPQRGDIHTAVVVEIGDRGAIVDAGFKRDGIVPPGDLDRLDEETRSSIQVDDEIAVAVRKPQDEEGRLILSIYQALVQEDWRRAQEMMDQGEMYEAEITGFNQGGLLCQFARIRGFIPASHTVGMPRGLRGEERRARLAERVGEEVGLKIIEVDPNRRRLILSEREARRAWQEVQRKRVMEKLTEGETVRGSVTGITDFGAFVDLGGADGLVHISELSWKQVDDPREVVEIGDEVDVFVLDLDWKRTRIALSLKRLQPNPWTQVAEYYEEGQLVEGTVTRVLDFGAFVELDLGVEGLLHVSEMTGSAQLSPSEIVESGQEALVKIISIDSHKERIALSARQVHRDQWERWMAEHEIAPQVEEEAAAGEAEVSEAEPAEARAEIGEPSEEEKEEAAEEEEVTPPEAEEEAAPPEPESEVGEEAEEQVAADEREAGEPIEAEAETEAKEPSKEDEEETAELEDASAEEAEAEPAAAEAEEEDTETDEGDAPEEEETTPEEEPESEETEKAT